MVDHNAVSEAKKLGIPVFGIIDTNADPDLVDFPIPGNDDAVGSVRIILQVMADAVVEAKGGLPVVAYTKDEEFLDRYAAMKAETRAANEERRSQSTPRYSQNDDVKFEVKTDAPFRKEKASYTAKKEVVAQPVAEDVEGE